MNLQTYTGGSVQTNGYLIEGPEGWVAIDAPSGFDTVIAKANANIVGTLLTHQHFDHVESAHALPALQAYEPLNRDLVMDARARENGLPVTVPDFTVEEILKEKATVTLAGLIFQILHVPGHSPDSLAFYLESENLLFAGDALFHGSIGRTDLPGGDHETLLTSIRQDLYSLPEHTTVLPGHGPPTTIVQEKKTNPYVRG